MEQTDANEILKARPQLDEFIMIHDLLGDLRAIYSILLEGCKYGLSQYLLIILGNA